MCKSACLQPTVDVGEVRAECFGREDFMGSEDVALRFVATLDVDARVRDRMTKLVSVPGAVGMVGERVAMMACTITVAPSKGARTLAHCPKRRPPGFPHAAARGPGVAIRAEQECVRTGRASRTNRLVHTSYITHKDAVVL